MGRRRSSTDARSTNETLAKSKLKVPSKQPQKGRLWLNDGPCVRLRPAHRDHVCPYDFVHHRTADGRAFSTLNLIDEYTRECLASRVRRKLNSIDVIDLLTDLFILRGIPAYISDKALSSWPRRLEIGSPPSELRPPISNPDHRGRTATASPARPVLGTNA